MEYKKGRGSKVLGLKISPVSAEQLSFILPCVFDFIAISCLKKTKDLV